MTDDPPMNRDSGVHDGESLAEYHIRLIQEGIRDADAGNLIDDEDIEKVVRRLRKKPSL